MQQRFQALEILQFKTFEKQVEIKQKGLTSQAHTVRFSRLLQQILFPFSVVNVFILHGNDFNVHNNCTLRTFIYHGSTGKKRKS